MVGGKKYQHPELMKEQRPQTLLNGSATYSGEYLDMTTVSE